MGVTDYHSTQKGEMAVVPYVAYEIEMAKHKRREKWLTIALAFSVVIGIITHFIH